MQDNFDVHGWKLDNLLEESRTGADAAQLVIAKIRSLSKKLSDDEMDKFIVDIASFIDCTPPSYRLNEEAGPRQKVLNINDLTFNLVKSMFPNIGSGYGSSVSFPNPDDSSRSVSNEDDLESWKAQTIDKYGNVNLKIDTEASSPWEKVQVLDDKFRDDKQSYIDGKAATLKNWGTSV